MAGLPRALIVEDDAALRLLARVNLELDGFEVSEAGSLADAEELLAGSPPDVVLLDMHLGGGESYDLLARLRADGVPVGVVTGSADLDSIRPLADEVLGKPFVPDELVGMARRLARVGR
jgi:DNA-binding response OmpR family regulator